MKRDYKNRYYTQNPRNMVPIRAEQEAKRPVKPLSAFWKPDPAHTKGQDQSWKQPRTIPDLSFRPEKGIDLTMKAEPVVQRENKMPFRRSKYYDKKDYPK